MSPPVLFVIDDDVGVMRTLHDDLGRRFGEDFRVIAESSAAVGVAMLRELAGQHEPVALHTFASAGSDDSSRRPAVPAHQPRCPVR
jgi:hypothetical protein